MADQDTNKPVKKEPTFDVSSLNEVDVNADSSSRKEPTIDAPKVDIDATPGITNGAPDQPKATTDATTDNEEQGIAEPAAIDTPVAEEEKVIPANGFAYDQAPENEDEPESKTSENAPEIPVNTALDPEQLENMKGLIGHFAQFHNATFSDHLTNQINGVDQDEEGNSLFSLKSGGALKFMNNALMDRDQYGQPVTAEFVQFVGDKMDNTSASAVVEAAQAKGWESINVHGSQEDKEELWIAAKNAGMGVSNFIPSPEKLQQWTDEGRFDKPTEVDINTPAVSDAKQTSRFVADLEAKAADQEPVADVAAETPSDDAPSNEANDIEAPAKDEMPSRETTDIETPAEDKPQTSKFASSLNATDNTPNAPSQDDDIQSEFMSQVEQDMANLDEQIKDLKEKGSEPKETIEQREKMRNVINKIGTNLQDNKPIPTEQFEKIKEHYFNGDYKQASYVAAMNVKIKSDVGSNKPEESKLKAETKMESTAPAKPSNKSAPKI